MARTTPTMNATACPDDVKRYRLTIQGDGASDDLQVLEWKGISGADARALRGSGWDGDLDELRMGGSSQFPTTRRGVCDTECDAGPRLRDCQPLNP